MKNRNKDVYVYLEKLTPERRAALSQIRDIVFEIAPEAVEKIWYGMPTYEDKGNLCSFASQKHYMSLYIYDTDLVAKYASRLKPLSLGKSCIRFKTIEELPLELINKILRESKNHS